jgi:hypothetical protein
LPLVLTARAGSKPTDAIFETPSGVRPSVRAELKTRSTGVIEFNIKLDRASIPVGPVLCVGAKPTTQLRTSFSVQAPTGATISADERLSWHCLGRQLRTP